MKAPELIESRGSDANTLSNLVQVEAETKLGNTTNKSSIKEPDTLILIKIYTALWWWLITISTEVLDPNLKREILKILCCFYNFDFEFYSAYKCYNSNTISKPETTLMFHQNYI